MTIARQMELTLVGDADHKEAILAGLQELGAIHLVPLQESTLDSGPDAADDLREAYHYLLASPAKRRPQRPSDQRSLDKIVDTVLKNKYQREDLLDRIEVARRRQRVLGGWGHFEFPTLEEIDHHCSP